MKINAFNIRVYGCCIKNNKILGLYESYAGEKLVKLPGGGLEFGEGLIDCLKREFLEELNITIEVLEHLYTQEEFLVSKFKENEQIICIYYKINILDDENLRLEKGIDHYQWINLEVENPFTLPIDLLVMEKILKKN